jgi:hypothetical protein
MAEVECDRCSGSGQMTCPICHRRGVTMRHRLSGDLDTSLRPRTVRCDLCGGRRTISVPDPKPQRPATLQPSDSLREEVQRMYKLVLTHGRPGARAALITVVAYGIKNGLIPMTKSELHKLTGSNTYISGETDKLIRWLKREGWLDVLANA